MTTISCNFINNLSKNLKDSLKCANRFQRTKKISETEIFSIMCYQIQDNSYTDTVNYFLENTGKHITEASIVYRRKQISTDILTNVYNNLYNKYKYLFKDCKSKFSLQMVDGSNISLLPSLLLSRFFPLSLLSLLSLLPLPPESSGDFDLDLHELDRDLLPELW